MALLTALRLISSRLTVKNMKSQRPIGIENNVISLTDNRNERSLFRDPLQHADDGLKNPDDGEQKVSDCFVIVRSYLCQN